jgi:hypothetical protein
MEEAMNWMRNKEPADILDEPDGVESKNIGGVPLPSAEKPKDVDLVMDWLRNKGAKLPVDVPPDPLEYAGVPQTDIPDAKAKEDAMDWLRNKDPQHPDEPIEPINPFQTVPATGIPQPGKPEDHPEWDWNRNRAPPGVDEPTPLNYEGPDGPVAVTQRPSDQPGTGPEDNPEWDWNRNRAPPGVDEPTPLNYEGPDGPLDVKQRPSEPKSENPEDHPAWDWNRNRAPPGVDEPSPLDYDDVPSPDIENPDMNYPLEPIDNPDVVDGSAPWASAPDEESEDGRGPKPMALPEDIYSEPSSEEKEEPKGTVMPVPMMLTVAVLASIIGTSAMSSPMPAQTGPPPGVLGPSSSGPPVLPQLPTVPTVPCVQDPACAFIMGAIDPVYPPSTRALLNIPGTCQNWSREWLRTGKDVMEFQVERIRQRFSMALMYCEFNGDNWLEGELWVSDLHECDWYTMVGVDPCGRREQYQIIRNYGQQMRGTLPPEISMISTLWEITLSDNLLSGELPKDFERLSELDTVSLSFNLFTGTIPTFMWEFFDMTHLDLAYNFFEGTIPDNKISVDEPNLKNLFLENNDISGSIPQDFGNMKFKRLHMDGNQLTGPIPADIHYSGMEELMLHNNQLTGTFPTSEFADDIATGKSPLKQVTIQNNNLAEGSSVEEMCPLTQSGSLTTFEVDATIDCSCCTAGL